MPTRQELRYQSMMKELLKEADSLKDAGVKRILKLLDDARKRTIANLHDAVSGSWDAYHLPRLKAATERAIGRFAEQSNLSLGSMEGQVWDLGQEFIDNPLKVMGVSVQAPELNLTALEVLKDYSASRISGLTADLASKIESEIQLGILGEKNPFEIMQTIGRKLTDPGPFKSIAHRAETITRTEMARVQNMASSKRLEQIKQSVPEMMHQWLWSGKSRSNHATAHGQVKPVGEPYLIWNPKTGMFDRMMHPGDPGAPAEQTINCGCGETAYMPGWPALEGLKKAA